jgi:hypothetical protein
MELKIFEKIHTPLEAEADTQLTPVSRAPGFGPPRYKPRELLSIAAKHEFGHVAAILHLADYLDRTTCESGERADGPAGPSLAAKASGRETQAVAGARRRDLSVRLARKMVEERKGKVLRPAAEEHKETIDLDCQREKFIERFYAEYPDEKRVGLRTFERDKPLRSVNLTFPVGNPGKGNPG